jgi:dTDP-4-dehydrorhamnose 3,5-epimerase
MTFTETPLGGAYIIDADIFHDSRGFFARTFCRREFEARGLDTDVGQGNFAFNHARGTIRGMHFQYPPAAESKLVRCVRGAILDVIVDLRPESPTFLRHTAVELSGGNFRSLYIPKRFAHGYQVLEDDTEVTYLLGGFYTPSAEGGLPFDDARLAIAWPLPIGEMSDRDRRWRPFAEIEPELRQRMAATEPAATR